MMNAVSNVKRVFIITMLMALQNVFPTKVLTPAVQKPKIVLSQRFPRMPKPLVMARSVLSNVKRATIPTRKKNPQNVFQIMRKHPALQKELIVPKRQCQKVPCLFVMVKSVLGLARSATAL